MSKQAAVLMVFIVFGISTERVHAIVVDEWVPFTQPDGTTFTAHIVSDEVSGSMFTGDGYAFVYNDTDGYSYYAELDAQGNYRASAAKVGIDDPATYGIPKNLQRSAARKAAIQAERIARGFVGDPNNQVAGTSHTPSDYYSCTGTDPCTAYVVMLSFADRTTDSTSDANDSYAGYDVPWGYSWDLFNQFFNGGYDLDDDGPDPEIDPYTGTIAHPATGHTTENLEVFGSLRAYFHEVIGQDVVRFEILNRENPGNSQPVWIQLPRTKRDYAEDVSVGHNDFFAHAEQVTQNHFGTSLPANFPLASSADAIKQRNKVIYLYAGVTVSNQSSRRPTPPNYVSDSGLHPQVNVTTRSGTGNIGYQYMMGERQGWPLIINEWNDGRPSDRFSGIGMHVHEWGHLFGLRHPVADWTGMNPYTSQTVTVSQANTLGWGSMHTGAHGPPIQGVGGWTLTFRSCPNPYNPFSRWELGWNTATTINSTSIGQTINPGPADFYVVEGQNGHDYILDFRTNSNFGQYNEWYRFNSSVGLLIWRRERGEHLGWTQNPMLIPADGRSIFDARARACGRSNNDPCPEPTTPDPNYVYIWQDRLSDPFGARPRAERPSDPQSSQVMDYGDPVLQVTDGDPSVYEQLRHRTSTNPCSTPPCMVSNPTQDIGDSHLAFRNIRNEGTHAVVDIYLNYWSGSITGTATWSGTVYVGGDVTIVSGATLTIDAGTEVRFLANTDDTGGGADTGRSELIVEGTLDASAGSITFRSSITDMPSASDWYGIRVASGGSANLSNAALRDGMRCVENDADGDVTLTGTTFTNCGLEPLASIVGPTTPSVEESLDAAGFASDPVDVGVYTYTDPNPNAPVWSLIGVDADEFNLVQKTSNANNERTLQFKQPPNYEVPLEGGGYKTTYAVGVKVTDTPVSGAVSTNGDALADTLLVTVTVINVEEGGSVTLAPLPPEVGTATVATLTDPDEGIVFTGARWTWQRRASETAAWEPVSAAVGGMTDNYAELRSYTPVDADIGYQLRATVNYTDNYGPNNTAASDASPAVIAATHRLLAITGPESVSYAEHDTVAVGPYTVTGEPGVTITWSRLGADASAFTLDGGVLRFAATPNFEAPADVDTDNEYAVSVVASDGTVADTLDVTIAVSNAEDVGTLVLQGLTDAPVVGTALVALLTDEDGNISVPVDGWQWQRKQPDETEWEDITAPAVGSTAETPPTMHSYTPTDADRDHRLRVQVSYTDGYGEDTATLWSAATTGIVSGSDRPPTLTGKPVVPVAENSQRVGDYTADDPDGDAVTWLVLTGSDHEAFELTGSNKDAKRTLQFKADALPNFEQKTRYSVTLTVESTSGSEGEGVASTRSVESGVRGANGVQTTALTVTVDITNVKEPPGRPAVTIEVPDTTGHTTLHVRWTVANTGPPLSYILLYLGLTQFTEIYHNFLYISFQIITRCRSVA